MPDDAAPANDAGAAFVFRRPCPSCEFTIGVRRDDVDAGRVRCPVCKAESTIAVEAASPDAPFREGSESMSLVPVGPLPRRAKPKPKPRWVQIRSQTVQPTEPLFRVTRENPYRRLMPFVWVTTGLTATLLVTIDVAAVAVAGLMGALGTYAFGARWGESATIEGVELTLTTHTPIASERVFRVHGARIEVERRGADQGVVVLARHDETLVLGATAPLSFIAAETLAERLRKVRSA